jgi:hypothetical protein
VLQQYFHALTDPFLLTLRSTNKHFRDRCRGMVVVLVSEPSLPVYPLFLPFFSFFFSNGTTHHLKLFYSQGWVCWTSTILEANHNFKLWTSPRLYSHGSGTSLLRVRLWKPLSSPIGVWAALCLPDHLRHVTRNITVEVVSFLTWEGEAMVRPQHREGSWWLGRIKEQILSCVLPYILNRCPASRDTQLPTKREGVDRHSLGQILNFNEIWSWLVYTQPRALQHF